jgi:hypothetical protein
MTHVPPASPHELAIRVHAQAINECNQRGGRMLSLIDLIDAGTVDLPLAAYLATTMRAGASLLVGARPGGAGKTAVMCALINFLPDDTTIRPAENAALLANASRVVRPGTACYLAHEIGRGSYYAYIWGREARLFFALAAQGHIVASNLHADTLEETRAQLCRDNGVDPTHLAAVTLKVYLRVEPAGGTWNTCTRVMDSKTGCSGDAMAVPRSSDWLTVPSSPQSKRICIPGSWIPFATMTSGASSTSAKP